jgi:hypothetical protein
VIDSSARLDAIIAEMNRIQQLDPDQKHQLLLNLDQICQRNQQRFFSKEFQNYITQEFVNNMQAGIDTVQNSKNGTISKQCYQLYQQVPEYHTWAMQNNSIRSVQEQQQFIKLFESNV